MNTPKVRETFPLSHIWALMWPLISVQRKWLWMVLFATPLGVLAQTLQPLILQKTIDGPLTNGNFGTLSQYCSVFAAVVIFGFIFKSLGVFALQLIGLKSLASLRRTLFLHVLGQSQAFFDVRTTGVLMTRTTNDVDAIGESLTRGVVGLISDGMIIIGTLVMMLWLNPWLTLIGFSIAPVIFGTVNLCRKQLRHLFTTIRESLSQLNGLFAEYINGVTETQRYGAHDTAEARFDVYSKKFRDHYHRANWWDAGLYAVMDGLSALSVGLVIAFVAYQAQKWSGVGLMEGVTVGILVAFIDALNRIYVPIREFSGRLASIQRALAALDRILGLLAVDQAIKNGEQSLSDVSGQIAFKEVSFKYSEDGVDILKNVTFSVSPGEVVALVGSTGSGKSTIARLLSRQYEGFSGEVTLDGVELNKLSKEVSQKAIVVVGQDPYLFKATIRENIHLWDQILIDQPDLVVRAAERACAHPFISKLPNHYDTICSSQGAELSAGQRQLITIARAFAREAPIVILDEATASVDALTEELIDQATAQLFEERTVLVIAHRLSTITKADRIIMLGKGEIVEEGTHEQLMMLNGAYKTLVTSELEAQGEQSYKGS
jgi:ATP-binding cassette, subfamily B, multidrug efflux pump